jgi:hypothetical protein
MSRFIAPYGEEKDLTPIFGFWDFPLVSLKESLEPFASKMPKIQRSIKEAKRHCHYPSEHDLTRDESAAILLYTIEAGEQSFYSILNKVLREEDRKLVIPWFPFLKLFDTALEKLPAVQDCIWRGIAGDYSRLYKTGAVITWWNLSSCSFELDVVQTFLKSEQKSTLFMIQARNGKNLAGYSLFPHEKEVLLPMGTKLLVKNQGVQLGQLNVIHLVEMDEDDDQDAVAKLSSSMGAVCVTPKKTSTSKSLVYIYLIDIDSYVSLRIQLYL